MSYGSSAKLAFKENVIRYVDYESARGDGSRRAALDRKTWDPTELTGRTEVEVEVDKKYKEVS